MICLQKYILSVGLIGDTTGVFGVIFISIFSATTIAYKYRITIQFCYLRIGRKKRHCTAMVGECNAFISDAFIAYCQTDQNVNVVPW